MINTNFHIRYLTSAVNADVSLKFLGVWRPLVRQLLEIFSEYRRTSKEVVLNERV